MSRGEQRGSKRAGVNAQPSGKKENKRGRTRTKEEKKTEGINRILVLSKCKMCLLHPPLQAKTPLKRRRSSQSPRHDFGLIAAICICTRLKVHDTGLGAHALYIHSTKTDTLHSDASLRAHKSSNTQDTSTPDHHQKSQGYVTPPLTFSLTPPTPSHTRTQRYRHKNRGVLPHHTHKPQAAWALLQGLV